MLGQYVAMEARSMGCDVVGTYNENSGPGGVRMDVTDPGSVSQVIGDEMPGTVVLCAAMTNVDQCEREPNRAYDINMEGALNVASACRDSKAKMVYISTDYVFNGLKGGRYHEFETPDPLSVYAKSKLEGERVTLDSGKGNLVCRVSVVYGWNRISGKGNFVTWIIDSLREERPIRLYHDQYVSPTYAPAAAKCVLELAARGAKGIMHTSGPDCLSRYQIGLAVAARPGEQVWDACAGAGPGRAAAGSRDSHFSGCRGAPSRGRRGGVPHPVHPEGGPKGPGGARRAEGEKEAAGEIGKADLHLYVRR